MPPCSIDLDGLQAELERTKSKFEQWVTTRVSDANDIRDSHVKSLEEQKGTLQRLDNQYMQLKATSDQVKQRLERETSEVEQARQALEALQSEENDFSSKLARLQQALQEALVEVARKEADLGNEERVKQRKLDALRSTVAKFRQAMGLSFKPGSDELCLVFTCISAAQPEREFLIAVRVVEPGSNYVVTQCAPALPAAVLDPLLGRLNASTDFAGFVKAVRAAFQALAAAGA